MYSLNVCYHKVLKTLVKIQNVINKNYLHLILRKKCSY